MNVNEDSPVYSRLFIVCNKKYNEDDLWNTFSKFGLIEDIYIPVDHDTGKTKGVAYIKFTRTSEAALALENMDRKCIKPGDRPLKVMVAANRSDIQGDKKDSQDRLKRVFITIDKTTKAGDIEKIFGLYGRIESVVILKDRDTGESRGFAYVKYYKFSEAAAAFESSPKEYRTIFAMPKQQPKFPRRTAFESNINNLASTSQSKDRNVDLISMMDTKASGFTRISFMCCPQLTKMHIKDLFDIVPGMIDCQYFIDLVRNCGKGYISYSNPISANHAVKKLNEFEYPPGLKIYVKPYLSNLDHHELNYSKLPQVAQTLQAALNSATNSATPDLAKLAEAIAEASKVIKMATSGVSGDHDSKDLNYCSATLPPTQPLADIDSNVAKRCFLVCKPQPPPLIVLRDIFCRFGDLINVYTLPNKTVGYARYASIKAADEAMKVLHGAEVCGVRIKVLEAEDENTAKKRKY